jgi:hypothetical protein
MTDHAKSGLTRRDLVLAVVPACAVLLANRRANAESTPPHLDEQDPLAKSLGYTHDVKTVDPKANPMFKPGSSCANCVQLKGNAGDAWRPCTLFPNKLVSANGWCRVWAAKPAA